MNAGMTPKMWAVYQTAVEESTMPWVIDANIEVLGYEAQATAGPYKLYRAKIPTEPFSGYFITMPVQCAHSLWESQPCGRVNAQGRVPCKVVAQVTLTAFCISVSFL